MRIYGLEFLQPYVKSGSYKMPQVINAQLKSVNAHAHFALKGTLKYDE